MIHVSPIFSGPQGMSDSGSVFDPGTTCDVSYGSMTNREAGSVSGIGPRNFGRIYIYTTYLYNNKRRETRTHSPIREDLRLRPCLSLRVPYLTSFTNTLNFPSLLDVRRYGWTIDTFPSPFLSPNLSFWEFDVTPRLLGVS